MKKILITGNRDYGLCQAICNLFDNMDNISYSTVSRSNGWSLEKAEEQQRLAEYFVENKYDIFINNSALKSVIMIAEQVYNKCKDGHSAYLIHGSTAHKVLKEHGVIQQKRRH